MLDFWIMWCVVCIVTKMSQTPMVGSMDYPPFPFLHFMWNEKIIKLASNYHHLEKHEIILVHIFQYFFINWQWSKIVITWRRAIWRTLWIPISKYSNENKRKFTRLKFFLYKFHNLVCLLHSNLLSTLDQNPSIWKWFLMLSFYVHTKHNYKTTLWIIILSITLVHGCLFSF